MRSIMKSKYSVPAYVASALLGAVALMAFYESPISPLPVPALPEPPVGRFPPEMPNISPNTQVPFRTDANFGPQPNGVYSNYASQRSSSQPLAASSYMSQPTGGQQQVLFPVSGSAQQRQMSGSGPVQQLAANLLSSVGGPKPLSAQRKSGLDYEASSRSLFGSSAAGAQSQPKMGAPANQQKPSGSFLSYFGLGGAGTAGQSASDVQQSGLSSLQQLGLSGPQLTSIEPKAQTANGLSNSHLVNKVKSYFSRAPPTSSSSISNANPYEQYSRMSFVQALMKDTAFLPAFLSPSRKSSAGPSASASSSPSPSSSSPTVQLATARMQVDSQPLLGSHIQPPSQQQQPISPAANTKRSSSGYGLVRAADRIAHALLDTFTAGLLQRNSDSLGAAQSDSASRKSSAASGEDQSPLVSATAILSDIMSSYNSRPSGHESELAKQQQQQQASHQQHHQSISQQGQQQLSQSDASAPATGRALEGQMMSPTDSAADASSKQPTASGSIKQSSSQSAASPTAEQTLVRKTRSIGFEYPIERAELPSRASQINNMVDFVADSYSQNRLLFNFVMNQVGLSQAVPYVEQILAPTQDSAEQ